MTIPDKNRRFVDPSTADTSHPPTRSTWWAISFGIDPRSLALFRMGVGLVLVASVVCRLFDFTDMYTERGIMPIRLVQAAWGESSWRWSLYYFSTAPVWQMTLLITTIVAGGLLTFGWRAQWMAALCWVLLASLHTRAPLLVTGGDVLLLMFLFWGIFLPWGQAWSWDARGRARPTQAVVSVASAAVLLQIAVMYFFTGISKCNSLWLSGEALQHVMSHGLLVRPFGMWLEAFPALLRCLTWATLVGELAGPFMLLSPVRWLRRVAWAGFAALHVGIELTMRVVIFSYISLAGLCLFMDERMWNWPLLRGLGERLDRWIHQQQTTVSTAPGPVWVRRFSFGAALAAAILIFATNAGFVVWGNAYYYQLPRPLLRFCEVSGMAQRWDMFSRPQLWNYRLVAAGHLADGRHIDLLRDGQPARLQQPAQLAVAAPSARWVQVFFDLQRNTTQPFREYLLQWLSERWNADHSGDLQVDLVKLLLVEQLPGGGAAGSAADSVRTILYAEYDPLVDGSFLDGERHGHFVIRHPNGQKSAEGDYAHGREIGPWRYWDQRGQLEGEGAYEAGEMQGEWTFYFDGRPQKAWYEQGRRVPPPTGESAVETQPAATRATNGDSSRG